MNQTYFPTFVEVASGNQLVQVDSNTYTYNPSTNTLSVPNLLGTASNATDAVNASKVGITNNTAMNQTYYPTFVDGTSGNQLVQVDSNTYTYNPGTNVLSAGLFSGSLINVVTINGAPYPPPLPSLFPTGKTLTVDKEYGDDGLAAGNRFAYPFKTLQAAVSLTPVNYTNIRVNAGDYTLSEAAVGVGLPLITLPSDVSLTGAGTQCVTVSYTATSNAITMVQMGSNSRIENMTLNLSSTNDVSLTGVQFPSGTSLTGKLRSLVVNVTSTASAGRVITGILSDGTSGVGFTASDALARSTVNVSCSGTAQTRGVLIKGTNRFGVRESVINCQGNAMGNIIGIETNVAVPGDTPYLSVKSSTVRGVQADVSRTAGTIIVGATDFVNNKSNGHSFLTVTESSDETFAVIGNLGNNQSHFLVPGTYQQNALPGAPLKIPVPHDKILIASSIYYTGTLGGDLSAKVYRNNVLVYTITLPVAGFGTEGIVTNNTVSVDFATNDTFYATVTSSGMGNNGVFSLKLSFY